MTYTQAAALALAAIARVDREKQQAHVHGACYVGHDGTAYWVTGNGEEVADLTKRKAIDIIIENITTETP